METTTTDGPTTGSTVDDLDEGKDLTAPDPGEGDTPVKPGESTTGEATSEEAALAEEFEAEERRQAAAAAAAKVLAKGPGGIAATRARIQVTGGSVDIDADEFPDKDDELIITLRGWVKTDKTTTEQKGGSAVREAVVVVDEITAVENKGRAQLRFDE